MSKKRKEIPERLRQEVERRKNERLALESSIPKKIRHEDFVLKNTIFGCMNSYHHTKEITAEILVLKIHGEEVDVKPVLVPAAFCWECRKFILLNSTFEYVKKKGVPICRVENDGFSSNVKINDSMNLSPESILMKYGYNVNKVDDLSEKTRHNILTAIIDNKIMSKVEILSYLDFFINQRKKQSKYSTAVNKWEVDRGFVNAYKLEESDTYIIKSLK